MFIWSEKLEKNTSQVHTTLSRIRQSFVFLSEFTIFWSGSTQCSQCSVSRILGSANLSYSVLHSSWNISFPSEYWKSCSIHIVARIPIRKGRRWYRLNVPEFFFKWLNLGLHFVTWQEKVNVELAHNYTYAWFQNHFRNF